MWLFYFFLLFAVISFYYYYTKDIFNPCMIFLAIWYAGCSLSCVNLNTFIKPWSEEMYWVTFLSGVSFFTGSLLFIKKVSVKKYRQKIEVPPTYTLVVRCLFFFCLACYLIEWNYNGRPLVILLSNSEGDVKSQVEGAIPFVHYGTIYLLYVPILIYYRYLNNQKKSWTDILMIAIIFGISIFLKISRGDMLIFILGFLFLYSRYSKIKFSHFLFAGVLLSSVIIGFMVYRVNEASVVMTMTHNPYFSIIYSYVATCYANLNDYIMANHPYHLLGNTTFSPLWTLTGQSNQLEMIVTEQIGVFNAPTYLYDFYHDYKIWGTLLFPFLLGCLLSFIYYNATFGRPMWNLVLATMQKAVFVPFFNNYLTGEFILMFPYLMTLILILFVYKYRIVLPRKNLFSPLAR